MVVPGWQLDVPVWMGLLKGPEATARPFQWCHLARNNEIMSAKVQISMAVFLNIQTKRRVLQMLLTPQELIQIFRPPTACIPNSVFLQSFHCFVSHFSVFSQGIPVLEVIFPPCCHLLVSSSATIVCVNHAYCPPPQFVLTCPHFLENKYYSVTVVC